jgi:hypothetical protein
MLHDRTEFGHNYNLPSRMAMYRWFARHLQTPRPAPEKETPIQYLSKEDLSVWNSKHPSPKPDDESLERQILQHWHKDASRQIAANPSLVDEALPTLVGRSWQLAGQTSWETSDRSQQNGYLEMKGWITNSSHGESVAATFLYPSSWNGTVRVLLHNAIPASAASLAQAGTAVCLPSLFSEPAPGSPASARHVEGDRDFAGYTHGYNHGVLKRRAHDILTTLAFIANHDRKPSRIEVHASTDFTPEAALALALVPHASVPSASFEDTSFRFASIRDIRSPKLVPGILRYGDLPALLAKAKR